ncbi:MAG: ATP-binding protein [SAR324 cluster bacterium]|nr:ATP-binding protein [SAR324 cluster bacterium]
MKSKTASLEMELAHKNYLLQQGFEKFIGAAEKLQQTINRLNREVDEKNRALEENKAYLSNILESLEIGVLVTDLEGHITSVNRTGQALLAAASDALTGRHVNEVLGEALLPAAGATAPRVGEPIAFQRSGGEVLQFQISATPMQGEQDEPLGYIFNVQDVTQLKKLEEQTERQNRFTAMGEMAANIAHEIRNPLGSIELFASLVKKGLNEENEGTTLLNHISSNVGSMNHIISNLLAYTKPRPVSPQRVDLHALLREGVEMSRFMAKQHRVEMRTGLDAEHSLVMGDPEQLKQVLNNLVMNAVQAMPEGGELTVTTRSLTIGDPRALARFGMEPSAEAADPEFVEVAVRDTGCGIPKDIQRKIFDPFFTTKARGTGLGLAIVHHIIESHRATIDIESRPDEGTEIVMTYPVIKE